MSLQATDALMIRQVPTFWQGLSLGSSRSKGSEDAAFQPGICLGQSVDLSSLRPYSRRNFSAGRPASKNAQMIPDENTDDEPNK
jgi:hypothetical protein